MPLPPSPGALFAIALAIAAIFLFTREKLQLETSSLLILLVIVLWFEFLPVELNGVRIRARDLLANFGNQVLITISSLMILARGLEATGALQPIGHALGSLWGKQPRLAFLLTLVTAAGLSMFLNNTPVVAAILPLLVAVSLRTGTSPSGLLMPVGFATIIGGMATTIGTSTNLLVISVAADLGMQPMKMFDFALPVFIVGSVAILYLWLIAPLLLPSRDPPLRDTMPRVFDAALQINADSSAAGKTLAELLAQTDGKMKVASIMRGGLALIRLPSVVIKPGDVLKLSDTPENLKEYERLTGGTLFTGNNVHRVDSEHPLESVEHLAEVVVSRASVLHGRTIDDSRVLSRFGLLPLAIHRPGDAASEARTAIGSTILRAGDVILVQGSEKAIDRLKRSGSALVLDGRIQLPRTPKAAIAMSTTVLVVAAAAVDFLPISIAALIGVAVILLTRAISWQDALGALDRRIIMVIVASLALGTAMMATGAAQYVAELYLAATGGMSTPLILAGFILIIAIMTELVTNNAVAVLGTPIAISVATQLGVPPEPFVLGVLYGANMSYLTPVGYQTNLIVMSAGGYKFSDFFRAGLPLQMIMWIGISIVLPILYDI